jgi:hypothetical protein
MCLRTKNYSSSSLELTGLYSSLAAAAADDQDGDGANESETGVAVNRNEQRGPSPAVASDVSNQALGTATMHVARTFTVIDFLGSLDANPKHHVELLRLAVPRPYAV